MQPNAYLLSAVTLGVSALLLAAPSSSTLSATSAAPTAQAAAAAAADTKAYTETIPDTKVTFDMVPVPGGSFLLGSPAKEAGRKEDEGPQVKITVAPFWMSARE